MADTNSKQTPIPVVPRTMKIVNPDGTVTRSGQMLLEQLQAPVATTGSHWTRPDAGSVADGAIYVESDRSVIYVAEGGEWHYLAGTMWGTLSPDERPTDLGVNDAGFDFRTTDTNATYAPREFIWSGSQWVEATPVTYGSHFDRPPANAQNPPRMIYVENDRSGVIYQQQANAWHFLAGTMWGTYSPDQRPTDLGVNDAGFSFRATDQVKSFIWSGSAWVDTTSAGGGGGGAGSQTPWIQPIDAANFGMTNVGYSLFKPASGDALIQMQDGVPSVTSNIRSTPAGLKISNNAGTVEFGANTNAGVTNQLVLANSGNVGVGTASPSTYTDPNAVQMVVGPGPSYGALSLATNSTAVGNAGALIFANYAIGGADKRIAMILGAVDTAANSGNLVFYTYLAGATSEKMRIKPNGFVGVGFSNPQARLAVSGPTPVLPFSTANLDGCILADDTNATVGSGGAIVFSAGTQNWRMAAIKAYATNASNNTVGDLVFLTRRSTTDGTLTEAIRILSSGRVGINTNNPGAQFAVQGTATILSGSSAIDSTLTVGRASTEASIAIAASTGQFAAGSVAGDLIIRSESQKILLGSSGSGTLIVNSANVGIGINPTHELHLALDDAAKPGTSTWTVASSLKVKQNIQELKGGLPIITQLRPIEAEYNGVDETPKGQRLVSLIAEEAMTVLPGTVSSHKSRSGEDILDFNPHEIIFHLILAVQQLEAEVKALRALTGKPQ